MSGANLDMAGALNKIAGTVGKSGQEAANIIADAVAENGSYRETKGGGEGVVVSGATITNVNRHPIMSYGSGANHFASWTFDVRGVDTVSITIRHVNLGTDTTNSVRWRADLQVAADGTALSNPATGSNVDKVPAAQNEEDEVELNASFDVSGGGRLTVMVTRQGSTDSNTGDQGILEVVVEKV